MDKESRMSEREAFEAWCDDYALDYEPLTVTDRRLDCFAAYQAACKWQREQIADQFADAIQSDLENGVKILNEAAANNFKRGYPALNELFAILNKWSKE